jgi:cytochrome c-type biogenesis protein CcmF
MIPEIGQFALILALLLAVVNGVLPIVGAARGIPGWMRSAWPLARAQCGFVAMAFACLAAAFIGDDFSVAYVADNSNSMLPLAYRFAAIWGGHEGSLLLWTLLLTFWMLAVSIFSKQLPVAMVARVLGVMSWIDAGFLLFMLWTSNPFERLLPAAMDGRDLNPLLQDPGMVSHPPILYMGYVGFAVAFFVCDICAALRRTQCRLGTLVAAMDSCSVDVPDSGHHARQRLGVLRTGLGRLVVLGSG